MTRTKLLTAQLALAREHEEMVLAKLRIDGFAVFSMHLDSSDPSTGVVLSMPADPDESDLAAWVWGALPADLLGRLVAQQLPDAALTAYAGRRGRPMPPYIITPAAAPMISWVQSRWDPRPAGRIDVVSRLQVFSSGLVPHADRLPEVEAEYRALVGLIATFATRRRLGSFDGRSVRWVSRGAP